MKKFLTLIMILNSINCALGQEKSYTYSKWYVKPAAGLNIPITTLFSGEITDNLIEYDDNSYYWQVISGNFFFSQKWGLEFTFHANTSQRIAGRADRFISEIQEIYDENYFVDGGSGASYDDYNVLGGNHGSGYFGIVYRIEEPKYIFLPKLFIGISSFYTDWGRANLKEKGTNTLLKLSYSSGKQSYDHFTIAPAFTFGYRLSKRIIANFDLLYAYYKTNVEFTVETRNTFTEETSYKTIDYKNNIHTLKIGVGLIIELKPVFHKSS